MSAERVVHCWKDLREHLEDTGRRNTEEWFATFEHGGATCMLESGHEGEHAFVPDSDIGVSLVDDGDEEAGE